MPEITVSSSPSALAAARAAAEEYRRTADPNDLVAARARHLASAAAMSRPLAPPDVTAARALLQGPRVGTYEVLRAAKAGPDMTPDLEALLTGDVKREVYGAALQGLARLKVDVYDQLVSALTDDRAGFFAAIGIGLLREGTHDEAAVAALADVMKASRNKAPFFIALSRIGGPAAIRTIAEFSLRMDGYTAMDVFWRVHGITARDAIRRFVDAGVIDRMPAEDDVALAFQDPYLTEHADVFVTIKFLRDSNRFVEMIGWDVNSRNVPRYVGLLEFFCAHTHRALSLDHLSETSSGPNTERESTSVIQFVHVQRAYRVTLQSYGDYYDMQSVRIALNRVLEDARSPMRFVPVASSDVAQFFFGDPEKIAIACAALHIPIGDERGSHREFREAGERYWRKLAGLPALPTPEELAELEAQKLREALPPAPRQWRAEERSRMLDARRRTLAALETGMGDAATFDRFRRRYLGDELESSLLDTLATWIPHYGEDATMAGLRIVSRLHDTQPKAPSVDEVALEGCVKLMAWGDTVPMDRRERLVEFHLDLMDPGIATFARSAADRDVLRGMMNLMVASGLQ